MFYSGDFYFDNKHSSEFSIHQVTENNDIMNEYGISYNGENDNEIVLSFCYANKLDEALVWEDEVLEFFVEWVITDDYKEFISADDANIIYFLKGVSYVKRFTHDMKGIIDVTFKTLNNYGYKYYVSDVINSASGIFSIFNESNTSKNYKPIIEISNISSNAITITNLTSGKTPFLINNLSNKNITIDNMIGTIFDSQGNNLIMNSNRKWIELVKGENLIQVEGSCNIVFKAYYPVMV